LLDLLVTRRKSEQVRVEIRIEFIQKRKQRRFFKEGTAQEIEFNFDTGRDGFVAANRM
jgi:hypothetical protein